MFVGYSLNHPADTYWLINLSTKRIIHSRDVIWLDKIWGQYYKIQTKDMVREEIEIYAYNEDNENQEEMLEEQEMHEQDVSYEEPEEGKTNSIKDTKSSRTLYVVKNKKSEGCGIICRYKIWK